MFSQFDNIHITIKPVGARCNLECKYCYYTSKKLLYNNSSFKINLDTVDNLLKNLREFSSTSSITWQGGEPTLRGLDFYKQAYLLKKKYGLIFDSAFQTNGINLNEDWISFFKENNFLVGISLDGPSIFHSKNRKTKENESFFEKIISNINLLKKHDVKFNVLTTVNKENVLHATEVYKFLRDDLKIKFMQFIPIVQSVIGSGFQRENNLNPQSITPDEYAEFIIKIFDVWYKHDIHQISIQLFDVIMCSWMGKEHGLCMFQKNCGQALCLEHNGDLYACDHFVEKEFLLGNINEKSIKECTDNKNFYNFRKHKRESISKECLICPHFFICHGECPKNWILKDKEGTRKNYLCESYKKIFDYTSDKLLNIVANLKK